MHKGHSSEWPLFFLMLIMLYSPAAIALVFCQIRHRADA